MFDAGLGIEVFRRVDGIRRRRIGDDEWRPPPAGWHEIVRATWPELIRHPPTRVPDGWVDIILAMADQLDGRQITIRKCFEDLRTGSLSVVHGYRKGAVDDDSDMIIDCYERLSSSTCRICGREGAVVRRGSGRLAVARVLCDRHEHGDDDDEC